MHPESQHNLVVIEGRATYERITSALRDVETDEAISYIKNFLKIYPEFAQAHNDLAVFYYKSGNALKALAHYEKAHKLAPKNITFLKNLADFYMVELEWPDDAIHIYLDILKDNPFDVEVLNALGAISLQIGRKEQSKQYYNRALQLDCNSMDARQGLKLLGCSPAEPEAVIQQMPSAVEVFKMKEPPFITAPVFQTPVPEQRISPPVPPSPEARYRSALELAGNNQAAEAVKILESLVIDSPDYALAHNDLGVLYQQAGKVEQALQQHQQAVSIDPANPVLKKNLADLLFIGFGQHEKALEIYVELLTKTPKDVELLKAIAQVCIELGQLENASHFLERLLAVQPWDIEARTALKQISDSIKPIASDFSESASSPQETYAKSQKLVAEGNVAEALNLLEQLASQDSNIAVVYNDLGVLRYQAGDIQGACSGYKRAVELDPSNADFRRNLADLYFVELGMSDEAIHIYLELLKQQPRNVETLENLGHICSALGQTTEAKTFYRRVLEIEPWNARVRTALQAL
jgi:Flp pilus assembly protein TadD